MMTDGWWERQPHIPTGGGQPRWIICWTRTLSTEAVAANAAPEKRFQDQMLASQDYPCRNAGMTPLDQSRMNRILSSKWMLIQN